MRKKCPKKILILSHACGEKDLDEECWAEGCCLIVKAVFKKPWWQKDDPHLPRTGSEAAQPPGPPVCSQNSLRDPRPGWGTGSAASGWVAPHRWVFPAGSLRGGLCRQSFPLHLSAGAEQPANRRVQTCAVTESRKSSTGYTQAGAGADAIHASSITYKCEQSV